MSRKYTWLTVFAAALSFVAFLLRVYQWQRLGKPDTFEMIFTAGMTAFLLFLWRDQRRRYPE